MRILLLLAALAVAACQPVARTGPTSAPKPDPGSVVVLVSATGQKARDIMHEVAARCWLDGVVRGAQLIIWPDGNTLEIVGETNRLVRAEYVGRKGARTRWKLSGTSVRDPAQQARLVLTLDNAVKTGNTACPIRTS